LKKKKIGVGNKGGRHPQEEKRITSGAAERA